MTLTLPVPPSANRYWRTVHGRPVKSREARAYRGLVWTAVAQQARARAVIVGDAPVCVTARWYRGRKSGDLDNRLKVLLDALKGLAYRDDKQVVELHAYRGEDRRHPRVEVTIEAAA